MRAERARELFVAQLDRNRRQTDRTFVFLLLGQWVVGIVLALTISPYAWEGRTASTHPHVWAALLLGGTLTSFPVVLAYLRPGAPSTRYAIAVAQMLWSALLIHLTGGRIETHFHVFGSLAFLAFYRDWRVLIPATVVVAGDHLVRQLVWPESVYGIANPEWWRFLEHAFWVVFEDVFLVLACVRGVRELWELAQKQADLEARSAEAIAARDAAEEANRVKGQFLANMSHELRTPINGVVGLTDLLARTELNAKQRQYVETVRGSGEALLAVVNDVLDFSKIEAGKLELHEIEFDPVAIAHATVDLLAVQAHEKGLELMCDIHTDVPRNALGDPFRLQQVLTNLVANAVKFTERGEVVVRARPLAQTSEDHRIVRFEISDTGIGIAPAQLGALFHAFSQLDGSNSRRHGGTGLGLAIAKQLVERMHGEIGVESVPGKGSTFWFTVRLGTAEPAAGVPTDEALAVLNELRVLVVDDSATNRVILRGQLGSCSVDEAADAETALTMLTSAAEQGKPYAVLITDLQMPLIDGLALTASVRRTPILLGIKIVMLTSVAPIAGADEPMKAGVDVCLAKPVRATHLLDAVVGVLEDRPAVAAQRTSAAAASRHATVLVAEDNAVNQQVVLEMLALLGYDAEVARDGAEALAALQRRSFSVVLMDCQMPGVDGYAAAAEARLRESAGQRTPIIAVTAHAMEGDRERALAAGMDDYLTKPLTVDRLAVALKRWARPSDREASKMDRADATVDSSVRRSRRVLELSLRHLAPSVELILRAGERRDAEAIRAAAHRLKGTCVSIGAHPLAALCERIEREEWEETYVPALRERASILRRALERELRDMREEVS